MPRFRSHHQHSHATSNHRSLMAALRVVRERVFSPYFTKDDAEAFLNEKLAGLEKIKEMRHSSILLTNIVHQNKDLIFEVVNTKRLKCAARLIGAEVSRKATCNIDDEYAACIVYATALRELRTSDGNQ